ncbi:MAG: hypothetical protein QOK16_3814 [Solirubrobacteraceae bacterium]|jgi:hypothetical protein|nr:hypothetical protein [Solirubrobacteraceae bacterium]
MDEGLGTRRRQGLVRLRWRLRGAWLWPGFVVLTLLEMALLHWLPLAGQGTDFIPALLLAGSLNLIAVALLGGLGGRALRRVRRDMPKVVADNYAGTTILALMAATFVTVGLVHRPEVIDRRKAFSRQSQAVQRWVQANGDDFAAAHVRRADTLTIEEDLWRTCVPGPDPKRWLCLIVDTSQSPPGITRDPNRESNTSWNPRGSF